MDMGILLSHARLPMGLDGRAYCSLDRWQVAFNLQSAGASNNCLDSFGGVFPSMSLTLNTMEHDNPFKSTQTLAERQAKIQEMICETQRVGGPLLRELAELDPRIKVFQDILPPNVIAETGVARILAGAFESIADRGLRDIILGSMATCAVPFDGRPFAKVFESPASFFNPRWEIASLFANGRALHVDAWIAVKLCDSSFGKDREMLCYAVGRYLPPANATALLKSVFDEFPMHAAGAMGLYGKKEELEFLRSRLAGYQGQVRRVIEAKGIRRIEKRHGLA